ncbi:MAG: TonB-dependent receptor [Acidobacteria bacterium]|nr:TonB-dependent receptor [Acidobacteriota bacterium]
MRLITAALVFAAAALAQTATITGRVTDPTGAVVPDVGITVRSAETGTETQARTNEEGYYSVPSLAPGIYTLSASKQGFKPVRQSNLRLIVQQVARLDLMLEVGALEQTVEVSARAVLLESETSTLGQVVGTRQITQLPLLGRNPYALAMLVPGVRPSFGMNNVPIDQISTAFSSINGARANQNEYLLDGAPNTAAAQNQPVIFANPDSVQEFKVETNSFSAEYGRAAGGVFNVVTRSGSNALSFSLYEFLRNDKLNANDFFANRTGTARAPFRFNQFGGSVGGPMVLPGMYNGRNRTFFFVNTELVRFRQGITFLGTVPRPEQLAGDFSTTRAANGNLVQIFDPASTRPNPSGAGFVRTPFPGNTIPGNRIDPVARAIARYWPAPNTPGDPVTGVNNFARTDANQVTKNTYSVRLDHNFSDRNRIFGRYSFDDTPLRRAKTYGPESQADPTAGPQVFTRYNSVLEDTHTWTPTLLSTVRYSWARLSNFRHPWSEPFDLTSLRFPAGLIAQLGPPFSFPAISVTGLVMTGSVPNTIVGGSLGAVDLIAFGMDTHSLQAQITKTLTRHTLKAGADTRVIRANLTQMGDSARRFEFTNAWTQGPNPNQSSPNAGYGLATFLLGVPAGQTQIVPALAQQITYTALYLQDDFKLTPTLTLNLGVRYDYESPRTDRFNQLTNFDFDAAPPVRAPAMELRGVLTFPGSAGLSRSQANPDRNNLAPRVGIAWRVTPKTVVRAGGGIFYASTTGLGGAPGGFGVSGFEATTTIVTSLDGVNPIVSLRNPFPDGILQPPGNSQGPATLLGQNITFFNRGNVVPYTGQWNFNLQRELAGLLFDVGYAGSRGLKIQQNLILNQLDAGLLGLGNGLQQQAPNPFFGQIASGPLSRATVSRAQLLRPYPQFNTVTSANEGWASSRYHSLQAKVERRFGAGLSALAAYTYSKLMDYAAGGFAGEALSGQNMQNWSNLRAEWASSTLDQTHRLIGNAVYELPFAKNLRGAPGKLLDGWEIGGIFSAYSGGPLGVTSAVNNTFSQGGGQRPNWNGVNPALDAPAPTRWLNRDVFTNPPPFTFGNAPRTFNGARSDYLTGLDATLSKHTQIHERLRLQFRAEFFNITNTPRFAPPNVSFGSPQFGVVSAQGNLPRIVQFGMKLQY